MALTLVIVLTFVFPTLVIAMVLYWGITMKGRFSDLLEQNQKLEKLISVMEKLIAAKDGIINKLRSW